MATMLNDFISREGVKRSLESLLASYKDYGAIVAMNYAIRAVEEAQPAADVAPVVQQQGEVLIGCALHAILNERQRQIAKWGPQDSNTWPEWMAILMEEVGELAEAINETWFRNATHPERGGIENIRREAVQVAAVAASIIEATLREGEQDVSG